MKSEFEAMARQYSVNEGQLVDAKIWWAKLDMENDDLALKLRNKDD